MPNGTEYAPASSARTSNALTEWSTSSTKSCCWRDRFLSTARWVRRPSWIPSWSLSCPCCAHSGISLHFVHGGDASCRPYQLLLSRLCICFSSTTFLLYIYNERFQMVVLRATSSSRHPRYYVVGRMATRWQARNSPTLKFAKQDITRWPIDKSI